MLTYTITPETGSIKVTEGNAEIASFYFVQTGMGDFDVFDDYAPHDMPVTTQPDVKGVVAWVMDIDPSVFTENA